MNWGTVFQIVTAAAASVGIGGAIVFSLSSWLGKVWADRILENEKHKLGVELEKTKRELDVMKETTLKFQNEKVAIYRIVVDVVARLLASFDSHQMGRLPQQQAVARFDEFNEQRIKVYGYLAMLAPQAIMDAQDRLMDHLLMVAQGTKTYKWEDVRSYAIDLLNEVRADIGIDKNPISYNGVL